MRIFKRYDPGNNKRNQFWKNSCGSSNSNGSRNSGQAEFGAARIFGAGRERVCVFRRLWTDTADHQGKAGVGSGRIGD